MLDYTSFDNFLSTTNRLPITTKEAEQFIAFAKTNEKHGLTVRLHDAFQGELQDAFNRGILLLTSPVLQADFLFLKIDAGRGLLGGQKHRYQSAIGCYNEDSFTPGATFRNLPIALTSINNLFRAEGFVNGPVL